MSLFERPINISINPDAHARANGYVWTVVDGQVRSSPFLIDRPKFVRRGLNPQTYSRLVRQLRNMGVQPEVIELHSENMKYMYDGHSYKNKAPGIPMSVAEQRSKLN